jgi:predicted DNA-binding transcriptional regulator AlpA
MGLLNVEQAAQFLQVSKSWLYQHPEVPRHRIPGSNLLRFDQEEMMVWLKSGKASKGEREMTKVYHRNPRYRT